MSDNYSFDSKEELTLLIKKHGIDDWKSLTNYIQNLPFGRNSSNEDLSLVIKEQRGTSATKHAFLHKVALENNIPDIELVMVIFKLNSSNSPQVQEVLANANLSYIPEAHCYIKNKDEVFDLTFPTHQIEIPAKDILEDKTINADKIEEFKSEYHKEYIQSWIKQCSLWLNFNQVWNVRQACIEKISQRV